MKSNIYDSIIIGGGLAGLSAAYTLKNKKIALIEELSYLGGRIHTETENDFILEKGAVYLFYLGRNFRELLRELNIHTSLERVNKKMGFFYDNKLHELDFNTILSLFKSTLRFELIKKSIRNIISLFRLLITSVIIFRHITSSYNNFELYAKESGSSTLKKYFDPKIINVVFEPISESFLFSKSKYVSSAIIYVLLGAFLDFKNNIYFIKSGFHLISKKLENRLKKCDINLNSEVIEIRKIDDYFTLKTINGKKFNAKTVISAIPIPRLLKIKKNFKVEKIEGIKYKKIMSINLGLNRKIKSFKDYHLIFITPEKGKPLVVVGDMSNKSKSVSTKDNTIIYAVTSTSFTNRYFYSEDKLIYQKIFQQLKEIFPEFSEECIITKKISKWENAFCLINNKYLSFNNIATNQKGFYICGDGILPGLDGVVESGIEAAGLTSKYIDQNS